MYFFASLKYIWIDRYERGLQNENVAKPYTISYAVKKYYPFKNLFLFNN